MGPGEPEYRPLGEARLLFEISDGADGISLRALRGRLGLDAGYLSRMAPADGPR